MARKADPEVRSRVLVAACRAFNDKTYAKARMSDIALKAGVAVGTVYLYFPSKEALVHGIVDDFVERMTAHIAPHLSGGDFESMIARVIHSVLEFAQQEREVIQLLDLRNGLSYNAPRLTAEVKQVELLSALLRQQIAAGVVYPYDPDVLTEVLRGLIEWVYKTSLLWKFRDIASYEELIVCFIQRAIIVQSDKSCVDIG